MKVRVLLLDLTEAFFEVVCGRQLVPIEGFPASDRTERRDALRLGITGVLKDSQGAKKKKKSVKNRNGDGHFPPLSVCGDGYKSRIYSFVSGYCFFFYLWRRKGRNQSRQR